MHNLSYKHNYLLVHQTIGDPLQRGEHEGYGSCERELAGLAILEDRHLYN